MMPTDDITRADLAAAATPAPASDPSSSHPADDQGVQPATDSTAQFDPAASGGKDLSPGPIPLDRHQAVLATERSKRESLEQQYAWAKGLQPDEVRSALSVLGQLRGDPRKFHKWLSDQLGPEPAGPPTPGFQTEDGKLFYSADQIEALLQHKLDALKAELGERLDPIEHSTQERVAQAQASQMIEEASTWPHFDGHMVEITAAIEQAQRIGRPITLERAYLQVVLPKVAQLERKAVLDELKTKPTGEDVRPGQQPTRAAIPDHEKSWEDLMREVATSR